VYLLMIGLGIGWHMSFRGTSDACDQGSRSRGCVWKVDGRELFASDQIGEGLAEWH